MTYRWMRPRVSVLTLLLGWGLAATAYSQDCNSNGQSDETEIRDGASKDCNNNQIPDECDLAAKPLSFRNVRTFPSSPLFKDLDSDGFPDAAWIAIVGNIDHTATQQLVVERNDRHGSFVGGDAPLNIGGSIFSAFGLDTLVANPSGYIDLAASRLTNTSGAMERIYFANRGDGSFLPPVVRSDLQVPGEPPPPPPVAADLNGDGVTDRLTFTSVDLLTPPTLSVELSNSDGGFQPPTVYQVGTFGHLTLSFAVDLDRDGDQDLGILRDTGISVSKSFFVIKNQGKGILDTPEEFPLANAQSATLEVKDLDRDNVPEILSFTQYIGGHPGIDDSRAELIVWHNDAVPTSKDVDQNGKPDECEFAVDGDYDGDGRTDVVVTRGATAPLSNPRQLIQWFILSSANNQYTQVPFGFQGLDTPLAGDYNGDGTFEPAVVRTVNGFVYWLTLEPNGTIRQAQWGLAGDRPMTAHFTGRAHNLVAIRAVNGFLYWFINDFSGAQSRAEQWGLASDIPFTGNRHGDDAHELIVARRQNGAIAWYTRTLGGEWLPTQFWGLAQHKPLPPADIDGDGIDDLIVTDTTGNLNVAYVLLSSNGSSKTIQFGLASDISLTGHFSGDSAAEFGVFRQNTSSLMQHFVRRNDAGTQQFSFGFASDTFVAPQGELRMAQ